MSQEILMSSSVFSHKQQKHGVIGSISRLSVSRSSQIRSRSSQIDTSHHQHAATDGCDTPQHNKSQQTVPPSLTDCSRPMSRQQPPRHAPHTKTNAKHTPPTYTNTHTHTHIRRIRIGQYTMYHLSDTQFIDLQDHTIHNPQLFGQVLHICLKRS